MHILLNLNLWIEQGKGLISYLFKDKIIATTMIILLQQAYGRFNIILQHASEAT